MLGPFFKGAIYASASWLSVNIFSEGVSLMNAG